MPGDGAGEPETVTLWRPIGQAELDLVAASGWRAWPSRLPGQPVFYPVLNRWYATKITREWNIPAGGVGYVTSFDVRPQFLDRYAVRQVGGRDAVEYWIPAEDLQELNANIVGAIREEADYRGPVGDQELSEAADELGSPLPAAWCEYLRGRSWFRRGWLPSECFLRLYAPGETLGCLRAWGEAARAHPGAAIIGGDGAQEQLVVDLREDPAPVLLVNLASRGWQTATRQAEDAGSFLQRVEGGTFDFTW